MAGIVVREDSCRMYVAAEEIPIVLGDKVTHVVNIGEVTDDIDEVDVSTIDGEDDETEAGDTKYGTIEVEQNITSAELTKMNALKGKKVNYGIVADNNAGEEVYNTGGKGWIKTVSFGGAARNGLLKVKTTLRRSGAPKTFVEPIATVEVAYEAVGAITAISPVTVTYVTDKFIVPVGTTSFTFTDGATAKTATLTDTTWGIV